MYERLAGAIGQFFVNDQGESRLSPAVTKLLSGGIAGVCAQTVAALTRFSAVCLTLVCLPIARTGSLQFPLQLFADCAVTRYTFIPQGLNYSVDPVLRLWLIYVQNH